MLVRCWGRGSILYSQIRLQFFSEATTPLDSGLYMCFLVLPPHSSLSGTGWLEWAGVGYFSSPSECQSQLELTISLLLGQLNSDKTPADLAPVNQFLLWAHFIKMNRILWNISEWFLFLSSYGKHEGTFPGNHFENLIELQKIQLTKLLELPITGSLWSFYLSGLSTMSPQQFIDYSSGFPILSVVLWRFFSPGFLRQYIVILCICLSISLILGAAVCSMTSLLLEIQKSC